MREKVRDMLFLVVLLLVWPVPVGALIVFGSEPHQSFALDDGEVVLHIAGRCSFASHVDSTGARNQAWGSQDTCPRPTFRLENVGPRRRDVKVRTIRAQFQGVVHLEPGKSVEMTFQTSGAWYFWAEPQPAPEQ